MCKRKERCPKCGGEHRYNEYDSIQDKCCNCDGQHRVTYRGCAVRRAAVEVEQVKAVQNISYAEAFKKVKKAKDGKGQVQKFSTTNNDRLKKRVQQWRE